MWLRQDKLIWLSSQLNPRPLIRISKDKMCPRQDKYGHLDFYPKNKVNLRFAWFIYGEFIVPKY